MMIPEMLEKTKEALGWQCNDILAVTDCELRGVYLGMIRESGNALSDFYDLPEMVKIAQRACEYAHDSENAYSFLDAAWDGIECSDGKEWVSA